MRIILCLILFFSAACTFTPSIYNCTPGEPDDRSRECVDGVWVVPSAPISDSGNLIDTGTPVSDLGANPTCGDGVVDANEECDSDNIPKTCEDLGFVSGTLACSSKCKNETSACVASPDCNNGKLDVGEECDPSVELTDAAKACGPEFNTGEVMCTDACVWDDSACSQCGDAEISSVETCDGTEFGGKTCESVKGVGFRGTLSCENNCTVINNDDCRLEYVQVSAGAKHTCALQSDGIVRCWGSPGTPQVMAPAQQKFSHVTTGGIHSCALNENGKVECWGGNSQSYIDGSQTDDINQSIPPKDVFFDKISNGDYHTCGIEKTQDQFVSCWGSNYSFEKNLENQTEPQSVKAIDISAGGDHNCILREDGTAHCWGDGAHGQKDVPGTQFTALSSGKYHSCGIRMDSKVECWGAIFRRDSSDFDQGQAEAPSRTSFTQISAGGFHTCGIKKADASVRCWGADDEGQRQSQPGPFKSVSAGLLHTCGVLLTGDVKCWGNNDEKQIDVVPPS